MYGWVGAGRVAEVNSLYGLLSEGGGGGGGTRSLHAVKVHATSQGTIDVRAMAVVGARPSCTTLLLVFLVVCLHACVIPVISVMFVIWSVVPLIPESGERGIQQSLTFHLAAPQYPPGMVWHESQV